MKPVDFPESNVVYAEDQDEYLDLPVHRTADGVVTSCWKLTIWERLRVLFTGRLYFSVLTFNEPLQPQQPHLRYPLTQRGCGPNPDPVKPTTR